MAVGVYSVLDSTVEAADSRLASEGHNIGAPSVILSKVPVLMGPELASNSKANLCLVHDKRNTFRSSQLTQLFVVDRSCLSVAECSNGFYNNRTDIIVCRLS